MGMRIDQPRHHDFAGAVKIVVFGWDTGFDAGCNLFDTSVAPTTIVMLRSMVPALSPVTMVAWANANGSTIGL